MDLKKIIINTRTTTEFRCRVCLETSSKMYPLEGPVVNCDVDISTMLSFCTSVEIHISKDLPSFVCLPCFKTVRIAYNFIQKFRENNKKLFEEHSKDESTEKLEVKNDNEAPQTYELVDRGNDSSDVENVENIEGNVVHEAEVGVYGASHVSQPDGDFKLDYEYLDENIREIKTEIYNCETDDQMLHIINEQDQVEHMNNTNLVQRVKVRTQYVCPVCPGIRFSSSEEYFVNHMLKHDEIPFYCNNCEYGTIYNGSTYIKHFQDVHKYQCPHCKKSCSSRSGLYAHLRIHSDLKYICNYERCTKVFSNKTNLKKHEAIHSEDVKHICEECGLEFKTYDTYKYHQKRHEGRKFLCTECGRTFIQSVHLKYHMWLHTGIKQFKCELCDKCYTSVTQLKKHKRRHHPGDSEQQINECYMEVHD